LALPEVGDEVFGFRLLRELGRGSFARVFCAHQASLGDRPVVIKISSITGDEPQTLAQLQHTNIVPIYSVHEDASAGLRAVCMPYFGGASLSRLLQELWSENHAPMQGSELVDALVTHDTCRGQGDEAAAQSAPAAAQVPQTIAESGPLDRLSKYSYVRACAWIVSRLAEALQHAHERGVLHRDIKPSNVLLGSDGQPMLLDFNLAQRLGDGNAQLAATLGGTVAYMAPEHLRALAGREPNLVRQVDQRADIYGLGMVLYEMLNGARPFDQSGSYSPMPALIEAMAVERGRETPSLRARRLDIPWSLESIGRKCLAPNPAHRYQHAAEFAEDLRRFLEDRPLRYAPELSWRERAAKWTRRNPRLATAIPVSAAAVLALALGAAVWRQTADKLEQAEGAHAREVFHAFRSGADQARCLVNTATDFGDQVQNGAAVCERTLGMFGVLDDEHWQDGRLFRKLDLDQQQSAAEDARELLLLLARARVHLASEPLSALAADFAGLCGSGFSPGLGPLAGAWIGHSQAEECREREKTQQAAYENALDLLGRADLVGGVPAARAVWLDRAWYLEGTGDLPKARASRATAESLPLAGARDHYLLAQARLHQAAAISDREYETAAGELNAALRLNPRDYWSHLMLSMCYLQMGDTVLAAETARACTILWPEAPWGYFNHGRALQQLGKNDAAIEDYTAVLERDPKLVEANVNRGLLYLNLHKPEQALMDFDAALAQGRDNALVHTGRGLALEELGRAADADAAFERAWQQDPNNAEMLIGYGFAVSKRLPAKAAEAFQTALLRNPRHPRALYGLGMLHASRKRDSEAAATCFTLAAEADPNFVEARCARANVLAHQGDWERARHEVDQCVKERASGATLYAAACVYSVAAGKCPRAQAGALQRRAVEFLQEAVSRGYGQDRLEEDEDLAPIRADPRFTALSRKASPPK
jgi:serine/threonine protein kinase/Tfp pilus assembly protein PilF